MLQCLLGQCVCGLCPIQLADSLRSHGLPVKLVSFMESTPHGIRRTLSNVRKMREIRRKFQFLTGAQNLSTCRIYFTCFNIFFLHYC